MKLGYVIPHEIIIRASANMGFIVKVGCGEFVAENPNQLIVRLGDYLSNPKKWEEEYNKLPGREEDVAEVPRPPGPSAETDSDEQTSSER